MSDQNASTNSWTGRALGRLRALALVSLALFALLFPGGSLGAQEATGTVLRIACVAPRGSAWHRIFTAWSNTLRSATSGRLSLSIHAGGAGANERDFVRRIGARELDGAALSALGFGALGSPSATERPLLVLQAPGLFTEYAALDRARQAIEPELRAAFREAGVELVGWSDLGRGRLFSTHPIATLADLRRARLWQPEHEPLSAATLAELGSATPVALPLGQVGAAIGDGRVDTVVASAMAVSALGWAGSGRLTQVSSQPSSVLVGGTVISSAAIEALPEDLRAALRQSGAQAHETLQRTIRRDDDNAYQALTTRQGMTPFAFASEPEWTAFAAATRQRLVSEHVLPRALLERVAR